MKTNIMSKILSSSGYIVVNKTLIKMFGLNNAVMIGELCSEFNYYSDTEQLIEEDDRLWFYSTIQNIENNTGLTRKQQDKCIQELFNEDIVITKLMGVPAKRYISIDFEKLEEIFNNAQNYAKNVEKSPKNSGCPKGTNKDVQKGQTRLSERDKLDCPKGTNKVVQKGHSYIIENNNKTIINNNNNLFSSSEPLIIDTQEEEIRQDLPDNKDLVQLFYDKINYLSILNIYKSYPEDKAKLFDILFNHITDILTSKKPYYIVLGEKISTDDFKNYILSLKTDDIYSIGNNIYNNKDKIKNINSYIIATLYKTSKFGNNEFNKIKNDSKIKMTREDYNEWFSNKFLNKRENNSENVA